MAKAGGTGTRRLSGGASDPSARTSPVSADHIDYMADIIHELQRMAEQGGLVTLGGLLRLAHTEARLCQEREAGKSSL